MSKKTNLILESVLNKIKPSSENLKFANKFIKKLNELLKKNELNAEAVLGGSMAKNTYLKNDYDADVFIKFNKKYKGKNISKLLENVLKNNFKYERVKGSRDYFHVFDKFLFELVPVLNVKNIKDADNVIDMSPMHVDYFKKNGKGLEDEVRLLKKFMKASRVYGAESFINGFSGHVVDLLILKYKSFIEVLKASKKWKTPVIIDLEKKLKDPMMELDKAKISGPMIIVDPVQENRNAAAALNFECYETFLECASNFLKAPNEKFFEFKPAKDLILEEYKKGSIIEFNLEPLSGSEDIAGAKILKIIEFFKREITQHDFNIKNIKWDFGKPSKAYFLIENEHVEETKIVKGPPKNMSKHCESFKEKHDEIIEKNGFLYAKIKRKFTDINSLIKKIIKDEYVLERCKNAKHKKIK